MLRYVFIAGKFTQEVFGLLFIVLIVTSSFDPDTT